MFTRASPGRPWHIALGIALVLSAAFATAQVLYWAAPEITSPLPWMRIYLLPQPPALRLTRVLLYSGWGVALVLTAVLYGATRAGRVRVVRVCRAAILTVLLLPYAVMALDTLAGAPLTALLCLATSAVALLAVHRVQLYLRLPARLTLVAFEWGALVGSGFAIVMSMWFGWYAGGYLLDFERPRSSIRTLLALFALNADFFSEVGKAAGVALVLLVFRRYVDGVVSGLVLGAASGIGLNLTETVRYMAEIEPGQPAAQFWTRQVVGLLTVHAVFSGLAGAGFGAALRAGQGVPVPQRAAGRVRRAPAVRHPHAAAGPPSPGPVLRRRDTGRGRPAALTGAPAAAGARGLATRRDGGAAAPDPPPAGPVEAPARSAAAPER
ncbi:PrsW family glutamic-type intramembrane protease [Streptomyces cyaneofuscatus]|uniref:PrsW family glutamic-type intramembrane protease n=1 Tax=Streptomyces cyaneofuscatus TaxID=66883 RepID=UPI0036A72CEA